MRNSLSSSDCPDKQFNGISFSTLHKLRKSNPFRVMVGHIKVNSVRKKFEPLKEMNNYNIDIFLVSETKLVDTFLVGQFYFDGYSAPYLLGTTSHGGGIFLYI